MFKRIAAMLLTGSVLSSGAQAGQWSAGPIGILQSNPYVGGESGFMFVPGVAYEGEKFVLRGPFADYYLVGGSRNDGLNVSLTVALAPNELEVDGDERLAGIDDRDGSFMGGVRLSYPALGGTLSATLQTDLTSEHDGQRAVVGWQRNVFESDPRKWQLFAGVEVEYLSSDYSNYYFGVSQAEAARSVFAAYESGSVVQPSLTLGGYYNFNENWQLIANLGWQFLASDIEDSPIVDQSGVPNGLIGLVYRF